MGFAADVLIVAGKEDTVADRLRRDLERIGRRAEVLDGPAAGRLFTILVQPGGATVTPSPPMFVRASAWWYDDSSADMDERFLRAEAYAAFWAAAALSKAVVINRAARGGGGGRMTAGALAAAMGTLDAGARDIYASGPEFIEYSGGDTIWGEDSEFRAGSISELRPREPLRARKLNPAALYEIVTVVGDRAFPATTDPRSAELDLAGRSAALCRRVATHFATITWAIDEQGATPVRLNPSPEEPELRYAWRDVSRALCADLVG
jgi:hypothetical protein